MKLKKYIIRSFCLLIICNFFIQFSLGLRAVAQTGVRVTQDLLNEIGTEHFDVLDTNYCSAAGGGAVGGPIYIMGDSLTHGMSITGGLEGKLVTQGWRPVINAKVGAGLAWGLEQTADQATAATISQHASVLIGLGTNEFYNIVSGDGSSAIKANAKDNFKAKMQELVDAVKALRQGVQIYWTNVYMVGKRTVPPAGTFDLDAATPVINEAIEEVAAANNIRVVDWAGSAEAPGVMTGSDGVHPTDYQVMADVVVRELGSLTPASPTSPGAGGASGDLTWPIQVVGADNAEKIWNFFKAVGLSDEQAAGVMGNLRRESGPNFDPAADQGGPGGTSGVYNNAYGIAQWDGPRRTALEDAAASMGVPVSDLAFQLYYLYNESRSRTYRGQNEWEGLKQQQTIADATNWWHAAFERSADTNTNERIRFGEEIHARFTGTSGGAVPGGGGATCGAGSSGSVSTNGMSFPLAPQTKIGYATLPCTKAQGCHRSHPDPAFDLMYAGVEGAAVYAITDGIIDTIGTQEAGWCQSIQFKSAQTYPGTTNPYFYWYGHLIDLTVTEGEQVTAGQQIASVATWTETHTCAGTSGAAHLHIDRGCVEGNVPQRGGSMPCRDFDFVPVLQSLWEGLPQS